MQPKKLTSDIEITEFLINEIRNPTLQKGLYTGICEILSRLFVYKLITKTQLDNFYQNYIENLLKKDCVFLFPIAQVKPRVKFLQNLLNQLKNTNHEKTN